MPSLRNLRKLLFISAVIGAMTFLLGEAKSWPSQNSAEKPETWEWPLSTPEKQQLDPEARPGWEWQRQYLLRHGLPGPIHLRYS